MISLVEVESKLSALVAGNILELGGGMLGVVTTVFVLTEYVSVRLP